MQLNKNLHPHQFLKKKQQQKHKNHPDREVECWDPLPTPVHLSLGLHLNLTYRIVRNDSCKLQKVIL